ncbi:hypothetical protein CAP35_04815 [Chitinophagaceae bacterium IBVUCB1]|nr:hypothetical protein CAP35_04815 [Chitinophagaceae bacterium IBVUCB1]
MLDKFIEFRKTLSSYSLGQLNVAKYPIIPATKFYKSFVEFKNSFDAYTKSILKGKVYNDRQRADTIFKDNFKSEAAFISRLKIELAVANEYIQFLGTQVNKSNIKRYYHQLSVLTIDIDLLIGNIEVYLLKNVKKYKLSGGRRPTQDPWEIYFAAWSIFDIERFEYTNELHVRDTKPASIFLIRQTIEIYGKKILGYSRIIDKDGRPSKKHTHVAWSFIINEIKKKKSRIDIPFDPEVVEKIYTWSNSYVHTTLYPSCYIVYAALSMLEPLFKASSIPIQIYNGKEFTRFFFAAIKISNYASLKRSFKLFLNNNKPKGDINIEWIDIKNVDSYVLKR